MRYIISFICVAFIFGLVSKVTYSQELRSQEELAHIATELYHENYSLRSKLADAELKVQELTLELEFERILIKKLKREITIDEADIAQAEILGKLMGTRLRTMFGKLDWNIHSSVLPFAREQRHQRWRPPFRDIYR